MALDKDRIYTHNIPLNEMCSIPTWNPMKVLLEHGPEKRTGPLVGLMIADASSYNIVDLGLHYFFNILCGAL